MYSLKGNIIYAKSFEDGRETYYNNLKLKEVTESGLMIFESSIPLYLTPEEYKSLVNKGFYTGKNYVYILMNREL